MLQMSKIHLGTVFLSLFCLQPSSTRPSQPHLNPFWGTVPHILRSHGDCGRSGRLSPTLGLKWQRPFPPHWEAASQDPTADQRRESTAGGSPQRGPGRTASAGRGGCRLCTPASLRGAPCLQPLTERTQSVMFTVNALGFRLSLFLLPLTKESHLKLLMPLRHRQGNGLVPEANVTEGGTWPRPHRCPSTCVLGHTSQHLHISPQKFY